MLSYKTEIKTKQLKLIKKAKKELSNGISYKAKHYLEEALKYDSIVNEETVFLLSKIYFEEGRSSLSKKILSKYFKTNFSKDLYIMYSRVLIEEREEKKALSILRKYDDQSDVDIQSEIENIFSKTTTISRSVTEIKYSKELVAAKEEKWGYLNTRGVWVIEPVYDIVTPFISEEAIVVQGLYGYLINKNGEKLSKSEKKIYEALPLYNDVAAVKVDEGWIYVDRGFNKISEKKDFQATYANGYAAFKHNGTWGLINSKNEELLYGYHTILINSMGQATANNRFFAGSSNEIYLYDIKGRIIAGPFKSAKAFENKEEYTTVMNYDDKWGFIDLNGNVKFDYYWDDAKPFNNGLAGVLNNGLWGFIDDTGNLVIDYQFKNVTNFNQGVALLEKENMKLVVLDIYKKNNSIFN